MFEDIGYQVSSQEKFGHGGDFHRSESHYHSSLSRQLCCALVVREVLQTLTPNRGETARVGPLKNYPSWKSEDSRHTVQDENFSGKMEYNIFKYNLFKYYLENFALWNPLHKMLEQFSQKAVLYGRYRDFTN